MPSYWIFKKTARSYKKLWETDTMNKKRKIIVTVLCAALALVLAVGAAGAIYVKHMLGKIPRVDTEDPVVTAQPNQTPETEPTYPTEPAGVPQILTPGEHILNFLLIGQDRTANQGRQRSDVMILCTVNKALNKLTLTSLQRDMYVTIPGYGSNRLNAAYEMGGMALLEAALLENFGLTLDGMVEVDFSGFTGIVDLMGGVELTLTPEEAQALYLEPGTQVLGGKKALEYARLRSIDSDFHRTNRQRTIIISLLRQNKDMSLSRMHQVLGASLGLLVTNLSDSQIVQYAAALFPMLKELRIESGSIPDLDDHVTAVMGDREVLIPDLEKARETLWAIMEEN